MQFIHQNPQVSQTAEQHIFKPAKKKVEKENEKKKNKRRGEENRNVATMHNNTAEQNKQFTHKHTHVYV